MTNDFSCFFLIPHFLGQISMHIPMNALFFYQKSPVVSHEILQNVHSLYMYAQPQTADRDKTENEYKVLFKKSSLFEHF